MTAELGNGGDGETVSFVSSFASFRAVLAVRSMSLRSGMRSHGWPEVVAGRAAPDIELMSNDREPHGVCAVEQLSVLDRVAADVRGNLRRTAAVPAGAVASFGLFADG